VSTVRDLVETRAEVGLDAMARSVARFPTMRHRVHAHDWVVQDSGRGPGRRVLVLLPGSVGDARLFHPQLLALGHHVRVLAVSYPGLTDPDALCAGLLQLLRDVGARGAIVLGSSYAAWWLQAWRGDDEHRVAHVVLANGFVSQVALAGNPLFDPLRVAATTPAEMKQIWRERLDASPDTPLKAVLRATLEDQPEAVLYSRFVAVSRALPMLGLTSTGVRVTLVHCDDDPLIDAVAFDALRRRYTRAHVVRLPTGGHYPAILAADRYTSMLASCVAVTPCAADRGDNTRS
jgi:hypothetical protein